MVLLIRDSVAAPRGDFRLQVYRRGVLVDVWEKRNLIVNGSKPIHAQLLGGTVTNNSVTQIGYGTNGAAPVVTNNSLTSGYYKAVDGVSYPVSGSVAFAFSLASGEDNGVAISEFGLLTAGNVLYSRITRASPLNKAADISLSGTWTITF